MFLDSGAEKIKKCFRLISWTCNEVFKYALKNLEVKFWEVNMQLKQISNNFLTLKLI